MQERRDGLRRRFFRIARLTALALAWSLAALAQTDEQAQLQQRVATLEQENLALREQINRLKAIRSEWFQWKYGLTPPEQVVQAERRREAWDRVEDTIGLLGVGAGSRVADLGAGHGFFSVRLSPVVGDEGRVYAVEIDPVLIERLEERAQTEGLTNVQVVTGTADDPSLPSGALDAILVADVYHEITDANAVARHIYEALKPGGRLVVVDYLPVGAEVSREEQALDHAIAPGSVEDDLRQAGFRVDRVVNPFMTGDPASLVLYAIVAIRE